ncbi:MAG: aldehyde dehydrogenase family protein [Hydrocarboniphaga sp.]|uniref:aldehyde dehydrogenase family protein n=1 Tax=Hydrocarboniphaga sp. TaxID=2033016 RepID=UPI0026195458|nr:aldehyde dehydrogenase family protein [Hydrocarboniphaga sp.]MDB5968664.1 aldehyde dehydrogenase family protein [Hydrocarboniphaga sp.]
MSFQAPNRDILPRRPVIIGDQLKQRGSGQLQTHVYPATGQATCEITMAGPQDVDEAVKAARAAFPAWRALPGDKRRDLMLKLASLIEQNLQPLAELLTIENGAPMIAGPFMVMDAVQKFRYYGGWADKIQGQTIATWGSPSHNYVVYEPYGVIGAIVPWNGPLYAATMVLAPALAAGNCVVVKSPELAPFSVMRLGELFLEAGFPPGVVNTLVGGPDVGEAIVSHKGVDKVQFVGSGATAKKVLRSASESLKPCGLELGGKSAVLVFADADLQQAARRGLSGAISASGQGCVNGTRLLVERPIYEQYLQMLAGVAPHIKVGDPYDKSTIMGPIITEAAVTRILGVVETAKQEGGRVLVGGGRLGGDYASGYYLPITLIADVKSDSSLAQNEVFGPVLAVTPFDSEDEAIALANASDYGLGAYVHTENLRRAHYLASQMQAGLVQVNGSGEGMQPNLPFGGMKHSGHGRLGGEQGLHEFLQVKNVWMGIARQPPQAAK